ncbi:MAG: hypothetical protein WKH64_05435, partial [Chloroflexia bacterium]
MLWVLAGVGAVSYRRERVVGTLTGMVGVAILLALGTRSPLYVWIHELIPPLRFFTIPARFLLFPALFVPVLAALGVQRVIEGRRPTRALERSIGGLLRRVSLGVLLCAVLATVGTLLTGSWGSASQTISR